MANLGHSTDAVLGSGICRVELSMDDVNEPEIMLRLTRGDETEVNLVVSQKHTRFIDYATVHHA